MSAGWAADASKLRPQAALSRPNAHGPANRPDSGPSRVYGAHRAARRGGLVLRPNPLSFARTPVCRPEHWLWVLELALEQASVQRLMRRKRRGRDMILAVAGCLAASADHQTGRNVAVSFQTIAAELHCTPGTVKKAVQFLSLLGFHIEVCHGRDKLTLDELAEARAMGAESQRAVASTRYLTIPSWARKLARAASVAVNSAPLPASTPVNSEADSEISSPTRAHARENAASRREAETKSPSRGRRRRRRTSQPPTDRELLFAARLQARLPWLRVHNRSAIARILNRSGWPLEDYAEDDFFDITEARNRALGINALDGSQIHDPLGYLRHMLREAHLFASSTGHVSRAELRAQREHERAQRLERQAAERAAEAARTPAPSPWARHSTEEAPSRRGRDVDQALLAKARADLERIKRRLAGLPQPADPDGRS